MQDDSTSNVQSNLSKLGFMDIIIHRNLSSEELIRLAVENKEGDISSMGALAVKTGKYTGRSPHDRFIVEDPITADTVDWGKINHKFSTAHFDQIFNKMLDFAKNKNLYPQNAQSRGTYRIGNCRCDYLLSGGNYYCRFSTD